MVGGGILFGSNLSRCSINLPQQGSEQSCLYLGLRHRPGIMVHKFRKGLCWILRVSRQFAWGHGNLTLLVLHVSSTQGAYPDEHLNCSYRRTIYPQALAIGISQEMTAIDFGFCLR